LIFIVTALILLRPELITGNSIDVLKWKKIDETKQATPEMIGAERLLQELGTKIGVRGLPRFEDVLPKTVRIWSQLTLLGAS
jgi:hypothetical protein